MDNLPLQFIGGFLTQVDSSDTAPQRLALVVDTRSIGFDEHLDDLRALRRPLTGSGSCSSTRRTSRS